MSVALDLTRSVSPVIDQKNVESFAIIGTREPDQEQERAAFHLAWVLSYMRNYTVKTGGARGIDERAMQGACIRNLEVYLPWVAYNSDIVPKGAHVVVYDPTIHMDWRDSVARFHPNISRLGRGAIALHARNYGIIHGCKGVIALPRPDGGGGTAQGIRIANFLKIPVVQANKGSITDVPRWMGNALKQFGLTDASPTYLPSEFTSE